MSTRQYFKKYSSMRCSVKKFVILALILLSLYLKNGWGHEAIFPIWESSYTKGPPIIDGKTDDIWEKAKPLTVIVREVMGGDNPMPVVLCTLHTDDSFYVMAQWPDDTRSDMRDPYIWNAVNKDYERPSRPDDQFAIEFPMTGEFDIRMLTLVHEYTADVWHWKAGRTRYAA